MEKQLEYFDALANAQQQALNNLVGMQNGLRTQWLDTLNKVQQTVATIPGVQENPQAKETLNLFNGWFGNVVSTNQAVSAEMVKTQENWVSAFEKQVAINREAFKNFIDIAKMASTPAKPQKA